MSLKHLHPGAKWLFRIRSFFAWLFFVIFISIWFGSFFTAANLGFSVSGVVTYVFAMLVLLVVLIEIYTRLSYHFWLYEFTGSQLRVERGIIWKKYSNIPYERVQNVDITRGIIARMLGFSTVNIQTAGYSAPTNKRYGSWSEGYIPAVPVQEAEHIREFLMKKISKKGRSQGL